MFGESAVKCQKFYEQISYRWKTEEKKSIVLKKFKLISPQCKFFYEESTMQ